MKSHRDGQTYRPGTVYFAPFNHVLAWHFLHGLRLCGAFCKSCTRLMRVLGMAMNNKQSKLPEVSSSSPEDSRLGNEQRQSDNSDLANQPISHLGSQNDVPGALSLQHKKHNWSTAQTVSSQAFERVPLTSIDLPDITKLCNGMMSSVRGKMMSLKSISVAREPGE